MMDAGLLVHADWGSAPAKRWMCAARIRSGRVRVSAPEPVGEPGDLLDRLEARAGGEPLALGFDFPIGVPAAYALRAGIPDFPRALPKFGQGRWEDFYTLAESPGEIRLERPFYPKRPGGTSQRHLTEGLGVPDMSRLLRRCEHRTASRRAACSLFWTLGGNQVGRAAIIGWRRILAPALRDRAAAVRIWPFHGRFRELLVPGRTVVAETYPAEACVQLGFDPPGPAWQKRNREGRASRAPFLRGWAERRGVHFEDELQELVDDGFGASSDAEDPFDALLGLLSMVEVAGGFREDGVPDDASITRVEGWILGQEAR